MSRIEKIEDIDNIKVHWSESQIINDELGFDDNGDIEKIVSPADMQKLIHKAGSHVGCGYDKTSMTVTLRGGLKWATESKFYICAGDNCLLNVLNKGE